jgi:hypothetical protein
MVLESMDRPETGPYFMIREKVLADAYFRCMTQPSKYPGLKKMSD